MDSNQASSVDAGLDTVPIDSANLTVEDLQDVTKYAGVDLQVSYNFFLFFFFLLVHLINLNITGRI